MVEVRIEKASVKSVKKVKNKGEEWNVWIEHVEEWKSGEKKWKFEF